MAAIKISRCLSLIVLVVTLGCAPAYHSYSGCRIPCHYCVPAPLPYAPYDECVCHSRQAEEYLSASGLPAIATTDDASPTPAAGDSPQ